MSKAYTSGAQAAECVGSGHAAAPGAASYLSFAAAPTFGLMALWTARSGGQLDVLCMSMHDASPLNGMAVMYALMSIFHSAPWLKLITNRRSAAGRT